jgi:hypothetical protein
MEANHVCNENKNFGHKKEPVVGPTGSRYTKLLFVSAQVSSVLLLL